MKKNMNAKRSACDRCHKIKMQCKTDGSGPHCTRCRNARVHCNYSEPGKPGRPVTKAGTVTDQNQNGTPSAAKSTGAVVSPLNCSMADENAWIHSSVPGYDTGKGSGYSAEDPMSPWTQHGVVNSFSDTPFLQLDQMESLPPIGLVPEHECI